MATNRPEISVIVPVYNAQRTVGAALDSVLRQTYANFEVIVINDGSTDGSEQTIRGFADKRVRIISRAKNQGLVKTLNEGIEAAKGSLIARQDADDESLPNRFKWQAAALSADPALGAVGGSLALMRKGAAIRDCWHYPRTAAGSRWQTLFKTPVAHSAVMYRRETVLAVGGYCEGFPRAEDYELWSRLIKVSNIQSLRRLVLKYSVDESGTSRANAGEQRLTHCRIAAENMRELLGRGVTTEVVEILAVLIDQGELVDDYPIILESARACMALFDRFIGRERGQNHEVVGYYLERLRQLVKLLPQSRRLDAAHEIGSMTRSQWMKVRLLLAALSLR